MTLIAGMAIGAAAVALLQLLNRYLKRHWTWGPGDLFF